MSLGKPLLEVGSNLFELIEFTVSARPLLRSRALSEVHDALGDVPPTVFAVNVAKVREVIRLPHIVPTLTSRAEVLGVFNLRGVPIPAINLAAALGTPEEPISPGAQVIVTEFSRRVAGFVVHGARRIRRVSWDKVLPPPSDAFSSITGMMLVENGEFVFILDFERILMDIEARSGGYGGAPPASDVHVFGSHVVVASDNVHPGAQTSAAQVSRAGRPLVLVVDDSSTARKALTDFLRTLDVEVLEFSNGEIAWHYLENEARVPGTVVISDVEMPRLDGYSLVTRVRKHERLRGLPVILHSSLTGEVNRERAQKAGADAYVSKFNRKEILEALKAALPQVPFNARGLAS